MTKLIKALWDLTRFDHEIMLVIAIFVSFIISGGNLAEDLSKLLLACLSAVFIGSAAFALNDYCDKEIDARNKRKDRPIVRGDIKARTAIILSIMLFSIGITLSAFLNLSCLLIVIFTACLAIVYDLKIKKLKVIGNLYIAYTMAIPFPFGSLVARESITHVIWILFSIAFLAGMGREIMKDMLDIEGDRMAGVRSIPVMLGEKLSKNLTSTFYMSAIALSLTPFFMEGAYFHDFVYILLIIVADAIFFMVTLSLNLKGFPLKACRKLTLVGMFVALVAFIAGALI